MRKLWRYYSGYEKKLENFRLKSFVNDLRQWSAFNEVWRIALLIWIWAGGISWDYAQKATEITNIKFNPQKLADRWRLTSMDGSEQLKDGDRVQVSMVAQIADRWVVMKEVRCGWVTIMGKYSKRKKVGVDQFFGSTMKRFQDNWLWSNERC